MKPRSIGKACLLVGALLVLGGCGGGGGGGGGSKDYPLTITVNQRPISATFALLDLPNVVVFSATIRGTTSATTYYVQIVDSGGTFAGARNITNDGAGQYSVEMPLADGLGVGTHAGNLNFSICADAGCSRVLGRTDAAYSIVITENPVAIGTWSRSAVTLAAIQGDEPTTWLLTLLHPKLPYAPYARFSDPAGIVSIVGDSQTLPTPFGGTPITLTVSPGASPGTHVGNLEMVYCRDVACTQAWSGVTLLPYTVTVYPATNLKPLVRLQGVPDWTMYQGTPARTGHVAATLNPANFSPRWRWSSPDPANLPEILDPVISTGRVFAIAAPARTDHLTPVLFALDEATGDVFWQQPMPDDPDPSPTMYGRGSLTTPVVAGTSVFVARSSVVPFPLRGLLFGFRVADGSPVFPPEDFGAPPAEFGDGYRDGYNYFGSTRAAYMLPHGDSMLLALGEYGNRYIAEFDLADGSDSTPWETCRSANNVYSFAGSLAQDEAGSVYAATDAGLLLPETCELIASPFPLADGPGPVVVPGTTDVVTVSAGNLVTIDLEARAVKWSIRASQTSADASYFGGSPAIVGTTIYTYNAGSTDVRNPRLEARRESDGAVLWSWQSPWEDDTALPGNVVATDNLVFVGTSKRVFAIDIATHEAVWVYPYPGRLAISASGVLYVRRTTSGGQSLAAINLN